MIYLMNKNTHIYNYQYPFQFLDLSFILHINFNLKRSSLKYLTFASNLVKIHSLLLRQFHFLLNKFNIMKYQCILIGCTNNKPRSQGTLAFLGSFLACLASFNFIFCEIRQADPKVLLKLFWEFFILTCSLSFITSGRKERKLLSEVASGALKSPNPPRGLPFH